ncbi:MAG: hypothetical protein GY861_01695 [bacterium]|nr:hypothetical protein [bacterium]
MFDCNYDDYDSECDDWDFEVHNHPSPCGVFVVPYDVPPILDALPYERPKNYHGHGHYGVECYLCEASICLNQTLVTINRLFVMDDVDVGMTLCRICIPCALQCAHEDVDIFYGDGRQLMDAEGQAFLYYAEILANTLSRAKADTVFRGTYPMDNTFGVVPPIPKSLENTFCLSSGGQHGNDNIQGLSVRHCRKCGTLICSYVPQTMLSIHLEQVEREEDWTIHLQVLHYFCFGRYCQTCSNEMFSVNGRAFPE